MQIPPSAGGLLARPWRLWPRDRLARNQSPDVSVVLYLSVGNASCGLCIFIVVAFLRLLGFFGHLAFLETSDYRLVSSGFLSYFG